VTGNRFDGLPPDPFADENVVERGERLLVLLVEAALDPDPSLGTLARSLSGLSDAELRAVVLSQVMHLAGGILDAFEEKRTGRPPRRLRRAWRAAVEEWRR
jgi:hypothetical protein